MVGSVPPAPPSPSAQLFPVPLPPPSFPILPVALASAPTPATATGSSATQIRSWNGLVICNPQKVFHPHSLDELQTEIKDAKHVRFLGAGHSFNEARCSNDTAIDMSGLNRIEVKPSKDHPTVVAQGGATLGEVKRKLESYGLELRPLPTSPHVTVGGAIANSVHATGLTAAILSDLVEEIQIIDAQGKLRIFNPLINPDEFRLALTNFGELGAIYSVTYRCFSKQNLERKDQIFSLDQALAQANTMVEQNAGVRWFWYPDLGGVRVTTDNPTEKPPQNMGNVNPREDAVLTKKNEDGLAWLELHRWWLPERVRNYLISKENKKQLATNDHRVADSADIYFEDFHVNSTRDLAIAIELAKLPYALKKIQEIFKKHGDRRSLFAIGVRFLGESKGALSLSAGRARSAVIEVFVHPDDPDGIPVLQDVSQALVALGGRNHMGKAVYINSFDNYAPRDVAAFAELRKKLDPTGKFSNPFHAQFGPPPVAAK